MVYSFDRITLKTVYQVFFPHSDRLNDQVAFKATNSTLTSFTELPLK